MTDRTWQEASSGTGLLDASTKPARTVNFHLAHMRCAEDAARSIRVGLSVRRTVGAVSADEFAELRAAGDSYYLLAAAHRHAVRRLERGLRLRIRVERVVRPVVRGFLRVGRAVTA